MIAGSVFERRSGGGVLFEPRPAAVCAASAAAAALQKFHQNRNEIRR